MKVGAVVLLISVWGCTEGFNPSGRRRERLNLKAVAEHVDSAMVIQSWLSDASSVFQHAASHGTDAHMTDVHTGNSFLNSLNLADASEVATPGGKPVDKTGVIGFIANYIEQAIDLFHNTIPGKETYGYSIILFTCLIKALTLPLTKTQLESTARMQQLTPLQNRIKAAYPREADEQVRNQALSQLFQIAQVNPVAGCLPAIAQIPIFISLYRALQNLVAENKLDEGFLWIPDLEGPIYDAPPGKTFEWVSSLFSGSPILGMTDTLAFLTIPLILFVSQSISIKVLQPPKDPNAVVTEQEQLGKQITSALPFIIATTSTNVPAGLSVYWIVNNILTTLISVTVKNSLKEEALPAEVDRMMADIENRAISANGGGGRGGGGSADGMSASRRAMMAVQDSKEKKKKSFDPETIKEVQTIEAIEAEAEIVAASAVEGGTAEEDPDAPKGPIGKILKAGNDMAAKSREEDAARFAEASASAMTETGETGSSDIMPSQRANPEGMKKRKKRAKPSQKNSKKKKNQ